MASRDQLIHLPIEECQQQCSNVGAVDIGVCHDDHLVIPPLAEIGLRSYACTDGRDHTPHLFVGQHLVFPALVGIDDFASQRQDRLILAEPATFGRATG